MPKNLHVICTQHIHLVVVTPIKGSICTAKYINYYSWVNQQNKHYSEFHVFAIFKRKYTFLLRKIRNKEYKHFNKYLKQKNQTIF